MIKGMEGILQRQSVNNENIINILVIRQEDLHNTINTAQNVSKPNSATLKEYQREFTVDTTHILSSRKSEASLSRCMSKGQIKTQFCNGSKNALNPRRQPSLSKSQSFTAGTSLDEANQAELAVKNALTCDKVFPQQDMDVLSSQRKQMEKTTNCSLQPSLSRLSNTQAYGHSRRFSKHRSADISVNHSQLDIRQPDISLNHSQLDIRQPDISLNHSQLDIRQPDISLNRSQLDIRQPDISLNHSQLDCDTLLKNLKTPVVRSSIATPDSGFCSPGLGTAKVPFSSAASSSSSSSTPRSSRSVTRSKHYTSGKPVALKELLGAEDIENIDPEDESLLDKSLKSEQWLQTYSMGNPFQPLLDLPPDQLTKPLEKSCFQEQGNSINELPAANSQPVVTLCQNVTSLLSFDPMVAWDIQNVPEPSTSQQRKVLGGIDHNKCSDTVTDIESQFERPVYSYMDLIKMALKQSEDGQMTLREILTWIEDHFPYFKHAAKQSWKSSVRCNLSLQPDFTKVDGKKHGGKWKMVDDAKKYLHRLPKPPVIRRPVGPKIPAATRLKSLRPGPMPILPKSVPYALVPLPLAGFQQGTQTLDMQHQVLHVFHQFQQPVQVQPVHPKQQLHQTHHSGEGSVQELLLSASVPSSSPKRILPNLQQTVCNPQETMLTAGNPLALVSDKNITDDYSAEKQHESNQVSNILQNYRNVNPAVSSFVTGVQKAVLPYRFHEQDCNVKPVGIEIHQVSQTNEKKIVFHLKKKDQMNHLSEGLSHPLSEDLSHVITKPSSSCASGSKIIKTNSALPLKSRSICKTVDRIQRSKSFDTGSRNAYIMPYCKGNRQCNNRIASVTHIETCSQEEKKPEDTVRTVSLVDHDKDKKLVVDLSPGIVCPPERSVDFRPESAATKNLIQQAWDQASFEVSAPPGSSTRLLLCTDKGLTSGSSVVSLKNSSVSGNQGRKSEDCSQQGRSSCYLKDDQLVNPESSPETNENLARNHPAAACKQQLSLRSWQEKSSGIVDNRKSKLRNNIRHCRGRRGSLSNRTDDLTSRDGSLKSKCESVKSVDLLPGKPSIFQNVNSDTEWIVHGDGISDLKPGTTSSCAQMWQPREEQNKVYQTARGRFSKTLSASAIVFHGLSQSPQRQTTKTSSSLISTESSLPLPSSTPGSPSLQSTSQGLHSQARFYRTKSRRKQVHVPLTTDVSHDRNKMSPDTSTASDVKDDRQAGISGKFSDNPVVKKCTFVTPPSGTGNIETSGTRNTTSSPNSINHTPLDFAQFLSDVSSSSLMNLCVDSAIAEPLSPANDAAVPALSPSLLLTPHSDSNQGIHSSTSVTVPPLESCNSIPREVKNIREVTPSSPLSSSALLQSGAFTPSRSHMTADPHFYQTGDHFFGSSPPLLPSSSPSENLMLTPPSCAFGHFFPPTRTPPLGQQPVFSASTPTHGVHLPPEIWHGPANSSAFLDSSLFDNLDSLMQNSLYELKTP